MPRLMSNAFCAGAKRWFNISRFVASAVLVLTSAAAAQDNDKDKDAGQAEGEKFGSYIVHSSGELGGRAGSVNGNGSMFDTYVNWGSGPRVLSMDLNLHAQPGTKGLLFDDFTSSSFGYGGDPNDFSMVRFGKGKWYEFNGTFRRDRNHFDYDLYANPLNPTTSAPNIPVLDSPHLFNTTRKMSDFNLTLFPVSPLKFRLEYTRNVNDGPFFTTTHQGTEGLLLANMRTGLDTYRIGVDYKVLPRTNISYDQTFNKFKDDTTDSLPLNNPGYQFGNLYGFQVAAGIPVHLGVAFNTPAGQPCATPVLGTGLVNPTCSGFFSYGLNTGARGFFPTEQVSLQSRYFKNIDLSARASYSAGNSDITSAQETFAGLISRSRQRAFVVSEPGSAEKITTTADLGITVHITEKLSFVDTFRWDAFRIPGFSNQSTASFFGATLLSNPNVFNPATCPPPFTAATCPQHSASSNSDLQSSQFYKFVGQNEQLNTTQIQYDFNRYVGADVGYRYGHRQITTNFLENDFLTFYPTLPTRGACAGNPVVNGVCTATTNDSDSQNPEINEHSLLGGVWLKPLTGLRINFDGELFYADNVFTRISPRHLQRYRVRSKYSPKQWITVGLAINLVEQRNLDLSVGHLQHDRNYNLSAVFVPGEKFNLDLNYGYFDTFSQTNICFVATPTTPGTISCGAPFLQGISLYSNTGQFGSFNLLYKPLRRITTTLGYTVTSNDGNTLILNPNAVPGPLQSNYHQPTASVAVKLSKEWSCKAGWNYWDYTEGQFAGPTAARNFHANFATASLGWEF